MSSETVKNHIKQSVDKMNLILADCEPDEIGAFLQGCEEESHKAFEIVSVVSNRFHGSILMNLKRYIYYFYLPLKIFIKRKNYDVILGWQQFHALNFAFFCRLFRVKKKQPVVAVNFTYKRKAGLIGAIYYRYMKYIIESEYVDKLHVPSFLYAKDLCRIFNIPSDRVIVTPFGTPDNYEVWSNLHCAERDFTLSIGRSNRDFDFLVRVWSHDLLKDERLIIISDSWTPISPLPENILHLSDVKGEASYPYIASCRLSVVPVKDPGICSGDTVLLNSMMMKKPVAVTAGSTLAEMYVRDGENGIYLDSDPENAAQALYAILKDRNIYDNLSEKARLSYLENFSRESMGHNLIKALA